MAKSWLIEPEELARRLRQRYLNQHRRWLAGEGEWPATIPLGLPSEREAREHLSAVRAWQQRWHEWRGDGDVVWVERRWSSLGDQKLPERLVLHSPVQVARWAGETERWERAEHRYCHMLGRWPRLAGKLAAHFDVLADYSDEDFRRLFSTLDWLETHPTSGLYLRQLPVEGIDTKWLSTRKSLVAGLFRAIREDTSDAEEFYALTGIRREPVLMRMRLLDPAARRMIGGLQDVTAPPEELAQVRLRIRVTYIVENLQTGLAFQELPGAALFMRLGYAVELLAQIPWLAATPCFYWGDLDTHGFAILNRLRQYLPHARSLLMDEATLLEYRSLWGQEEKPAGNAVLPLLTAAEQKLYADLCAHRFATRVRLEQERIPWEYAWRRIVAAADLAGFGTDSDSIQLSF